MLLAHFSMQDIESIWSTAYYAHNSRSHPLCRSFIYSFILSKECCSEFLGYRVLNAVRLSIFPYWIDWNVAHCHRRVPENIKTLKRWAQTRGLYCQALTILDWWGFDVQLTEWITGDFKECTWAVSEEVFFLKLSLRLYLSVSMCYCLRIWILLHEVQTLLWRKSKKEM